MVDLAVRLKVSSKVEKYEDRRGGGESRIGLQIPPFAVSVHLIKPS